MTWNSSVLQLPGRLVKGCLDHHYLLLSRRCCDVQSSYLYHGTKGKGPELPKQSQRLLCLVLGRKMTHLFLAQATAARPLLLEVNGHIMRSPDSGTVEYTFSETFIEGALVFYALLPARASAGPFQKPGCGRTWQVLSCSIGMVS